MLKERIVYLGLPLFSDDDAKRQLGMDVTELIIAQLLYLEFDNPEKPIYFYINSTGTSWYSGDAVGFETEAFAICDTLRYVKPPVHTICIGQAMGTAAVILSAGTKGQRAALPHASIVLHQPRSGAKGQATDIQIRAKEVLHNKQAMLEILATNTGRSVEQLSKDSDRMSYLTPDKAVEYGLIDRVLSSRKELPNSAPLSWLTHSNPGLNCPGSVSPGFYPFSDFLDTLFIMPIGTPSVPYRLPGSQMERWVDIYTRLGVERILFLGQEVSDGVANSLVAQMLYLDSEDSTKPIYLYINSPGGSVTAGLAIYDTMQYVKSDVVTICVGLAASMGAFLLGAGSKGKRLALPHSRIMIHQPLGGSNQRQASDIEIEAREILRIKDMLNNSMSQMTGQSFEKIEKDTDRDYFLSAAEAKDYGLIDRVIDHPTEAKV